MAPSWFAVAVPQEQQATGREVGNVLALPSPPDSFRCAVHQGLGPATTQGEAAHSDGRLLPFLDFQGRRSIVSETPRGVFKMAGFAGIDYSLLSTNYLLPL